MDSYGRFVRIGKNGQITIPKEARKILGVEEGDFLGLTIIDKKVLITPKFLVRGKFILSELGKKMVKESLDDVKKGKVRKINNLNEIDS
jgi:AbrB family looped-hinge helix DNA binding protein